MDVSGAEQGAEREVPAPAEAQLQALYALPFGEANLEPGSPRPSEAPSEFRYPRRSLPTQYTDAEDTASEMPQFNEIREPLPRVKPRAIRLSRHLRPATRRCAACRGALGRPNGLLAGLRPHSLRPPGPV